MTEFSICHRYQELRGEALAFSCECAGEGCPDRPLYRVPSTSDAVVRPVSPDDDTKAAHGE